MLAVRLTCIRADPSMGPPNSSDRTYPCREAQKHQWLLKAAKPRSDEGRGAPIITMSSTRPRGVDDVGAARFIGEYREGGYENEEARKPGT
jgi:hypothetical protein